MKKSPPENEPNFRYDLFFELSPDLLCIAGYDGYFKKINAAVSKTLGYSPEELYARPINEFVHPDHQQITAKVRSELTQSKPLLNFENKYLTKSGETVWLSWTSLPMENDQLIFAIAKNVTPQKRIEADTKALLANVTRMNEELTHFNYATSDDLRMPVDSLLALFDLIDLSRVSDHETIQLIEVLQYAGEKIKKTLNGYADQLKEKTRLQETVDETDLQEVLNHALASMTTLIDTSKATIDADFSAARRIKFNPAYLKSIFLNLITNSIKFSKAGSTPVISIRSTAENGTVKLIISDNGQGFEVDKMKNQIFSWHKNPQAYNGRGIGLYLVNKHVTALGGKMEITSELNKGTTVVISVSS